jgi:hypothetical protein
VDLHIEFERVLREYLTSSQDVFTQHALANFIRGSCATLRLSSPDKTIVCSSREVRDKATGRAVYG